ncbi:EF-hand calcium-binding domain-containing protein 5-like [Scyliorhinus canicula]|uniref:EF-hand calcium-binding domain-containing protein 5-like n=1 Tax=Scyliorhinus canicula TaxID=7830 RepID=UPI0018F786E2|nr:EF-hand calcium-binding domain-containing protein 5-like [Scyliorhinus canicula]
MVEHGNKIPMGKRIFDNALEESDTESTGATSKSKGFYVSAIHDPAMPKSRLETKRASFQTSEIGGLSVDDTKDDEDESEGEKLLWKRMFERKVAKRLLNLQEQKAILLKKRKHEKTILERKVPLDLLSKEWFNENNVTVQIRLYLLQKLLPTLILGLEKLLMEVGKNRLTVMETPHPYFNPINFLAQYLMRNNPRFCDLPEGNPYVHGLKHVVEQLKIHVVDIRDNRLSTLKAETQQRQKEREQQHKIHLDNEEKRKTSLRLQYRNWMRSTDGNVLLFLAQNVLVSFFESFADDLFNIFEEVKYDLELEETDITGRILNEEQFVEYMFSYTKGFSESPFQDFIVYLSQSSDFFRAKGQSDWWNQQYADLFLACDIGKSGFLNRHRIILLFEQFYDHYAGDQRARFRNPREWPVIELDEMVPGDFILDFGKDYVSSEALADAGGENEVTADKVSSQEEEQDHVEEGSKSKPKRMSPLIADDDGILSEEMFQPAVVDQQSEAGSKFPELANLISEIESRGGVLITSPFEKSSLNKQQFIQLMETFVASAKPETVENLLTFIQIEYKETKEEKIQRLTEAHLDALAAMHRLVLEALFEKWDNDVSGYLNLRELADVLSTYKDGMEKNAIKRAHHKLKFFRKYNAVNPTLSKAEFSLYIETIAAEISDNETDFDSLVKFLTARNEQNCMERLRRTARRKWLHDIQQAAETSSSSLEFVYKSVFQTLYKDSEAHGENKKISSSIALLRRNNHRPERGEYFLHYVACTLEDAPFVLNQALYRDMGVSFGAIDEGKPLHIVKVQEHGRVHIWNCHRETITGSFIVVPLKDQYNRVFGVLGVDTLRDHCEKYFTAQEINFYQGVAKAFSIAYHHVRVRNDILKVVDSAVLWLFYQTKCVSSVITYLAEPLSNKDYVLCKTMTTENDFEDGWSDVNVPPIILERKNNYFRNYLFRCTDTSEVLYIYTYKGKHICVPLRDLTGRALAMLDIDMGEQKQLMAHEYNSLRKMLKILHDACKIIEKEASGIPQIWILADRDNDEKRAKLLFHQLMLQELKETINDLNEESLEELRTSKIKPTMAHEVLRIVLYLLHPGMDVDNLSWRQCRQRVNDDLIDEICTYDPVNTSHVDTYHLARYFRGIENYGVWKSGCLPIFYMYHWAFISYSMIQLKAKLKSLYRPPSVCHLALT